LFTPFRGQGEAGQRWDKGCRASDGQRASPSTLRLPVAAAAGNLKVQHSKAQNIDVTFLYPIFKHFGTKIEHPQTKKTEL
jgi:hypothetical protein